jgi:hypothetical protein
MSCFDRMFLRMLAPCVLPLCVGALFGYAASTVLNIPPLSSLAGRWNDVPLLMFSSGALMTGAAFLFQLFRVAQWQRGVSKICFVCACLLGRERQGRWGSYRKCLGCGKSHSISRNFA